MEEKKVSKKLESKKNENVEKKTETSKAQNTKKLSTTKKPNTQTNKSKEDKTKTTKKREVKEKVQTTKAKEVKPKTTKVKQVKIETKPVNNGYTRVKSTKQTQKGKSGIVLLIIMLIVLSIYFINVCRNYLILTDINKRYTQYAEIDNYHKTVIFEGNPNTASKVEVYRKGNTIKNIAYLPNKAILTEISSTTGGTKTFFDTPNGKEMIYQNDKKEIMSFIGNNNYASDAKLLRSLGFPIVLEKIDNVDCYVLNAQNYKGIVHDGDKTKEFKIYIEKETGNVKQIIEKYIEKGNEITKTAKYKNEYNSVTDKDLSAPSNIGEYIIVKSN